MFEDKKFWYAVLGLVLNFSCYILLFFLMSPPLSSVYFINALFCGVLGLGAGMITEKILSLL